MHRTVIANVSAPTSRVFEIVSDLDSYDEWLGLVAAVSPAAPDDADVGPAWVVTIRAKVGPLARSKKLRMVRTVCDRQDTSGTAKFERREIDGRNHAPWTLVAVVMDRAAGGSAVQMDLHYGGGLWTAPLEPILGAIISDAGERLDTYARQ